MKKCSRCAAEKPLSEFYLQKKATGVRVPMPHCKDCHCAYTRAHVKAMDGPHRESHLGKMRARQLSRHFGITLAQYDALVLAQGGVCKICLKPETSVYKSGKVRSLAVDHDHKTGEIRGLLCWKCNTRIGYFEKNDLLNALVAYLGLDEVRKAA